MNYAEARNKMQPGDLLAFGGKGRFSQIIKWRTWSAVSHVGVVLQAHVQGHAGMFNQIIESTSLNGFNGVVTSRISDRLRAYQGNAWWLPLSLGARQRFDQERFFNWMFNQEGKAYDTRQAIWSAIDWIPWVRSRENFEKLFCSELVAGGFEQAGVIKDVNASEQTPKDVCRWRIYAGCYQLMGNPTEISGFNTAPV